MSTTVVDILLSLGAAQGVFLAILIFHKHGRLFANRFLGFLMILFSIILLHMMLLDRGIYGNLQHIVLIAAGLPLLISPLFYLYARALIQPDIRFGKTVVLHILPFFLYILTLAPDFFKTGDQILFQLRNTEIQGFARRFIEFNWILGIIGLAYMLMILRLIKYYSRRIKDIFSSIEKIKLDWLRNIAFMGLIGWIVFLLENLLLVSRLGITTQFNISSFLAAVYIYSMGYLGLLKSEIFAAPAVSESIGRSQDGIPEGGGKKYEKSGLSEKRAREYLKRLTGLMEKERLYQDSELTLYQLADRLSISPHHLSEVINSLRNQNFYDFINQYRVEEVKRDFADPAKKHLKILAIAYDAGFNSKTTFNTIFKKHTGSTPSEYRKRMS